jgi:hypothetical protein
MMPICFGCLASVCATDTRTRMASSVPSNDLHAALQPASDAAPVTSSTARVFSKRVLLLAASVGVVCAVEIGHRMMYNQDYDGDGHVSAGEMLSCQAGFFRSCTTDSGSATVDNSGWSWNINGR